MTTPANHYVIVTIPGVKRMRGTVVDITAFDQRKRGVAKLIIETVDILQYGEYPAVYHTPTQDAPGKFKVFRFIPAPNGRWRATGLFMRERRDAYLLFLQSNQLPIQYILTIQQDIVPAGGTDVFQ